MTKPLPRNKLTILTLVTFGVLLVIWPYLVVQFGQYSNCMDLYYLNGNGTSSVNFIRYIQIPSTIVGLILIAWTLTGMGKKFNFSNFLLIFGAGVFPAFAIWVLYTGLAFQFGTNIC